MPSDVSTIALATSGTNVPSQSTNPHAFRTSGISTANFMNSRWLPKLRSNFSITHPQVS